MSWLAKLLSSPDKNVRATAVNCPVCWAEPRDLCFRMTKDPLTGRLVKGTGRRVIPHPERLVRMHRRTGQ